jgi:hypothetical protein
VTGLFAPPARKRPTAHITECKVAKKSFVLHGTMPYIWQRKKTLHRGKSSVAVLIRIPLIGRATSVPGLFFCANGFVRRRNVAIVTRKKTKPQRGPLMADRGAFLSQLQQQLGTWSDWAADLESQSKASAGQPAQAALDARVQRVRELLRQGHAQYERVSTTADDAWDSTASSEEQSWNALQDSAAGIAAEATPVGEAPKAKPAAKPKKSAPAAKKSAPAAKKAPAKKKAAAKKSKGKTKARPKPKAKAKAKAKKSGRTAAKKSAGRAAKKKSGKKKAAKKK